MVNSVSSVTALNLTNAAKQAEVKKLVSYLSGESLKQVPDTFESTTASGAKNAGFFSGIPFLNFLKNKKIGSKVYGKELDAVTSKLANGDKATVEAFKKIFKKDQLV